MSTRGLSLWWAGLPDRPARPALAGDLDVDVAVVGAGFTGLWTAYALLCADPSLRVALVEQEVAGFGASGRNGGWCSALFAVADARLARDHGIEAARALRQAMQDTVDDVGRVASAEGIDCGFAKGGTLVVARNEAQASRARAEIEDARALGIDEADLRWLDATEARTRIAVPDLLGASSTPHCAALDPARLVRGLADAVERRGGLLYEHTPALELHPGAPGRRPVVHTPTGRVQADVVVQATEAFTASLPGQRRRIAPVYSLVVATEPLDGDTWDRIGLARRETFADNRHVVVYGQRTADDRIVFGGRGALYHFGSRVHPRFDAVPRVHESLVRTLQDFFPVLRDVRVTHRWGGPLAVPRDWYPSVGLDPSTGMAWAGGYVGDGVATSNLAGRTLADLVCGRDSELVSLPWVGHRSRRWEPEPLRWLGINAALATAALADRSERRRGRPSRTAARLDRLLGH